MADEKNFRRDVSAAWDAVRRDRRARRKLVSESDLTQSATLLRAHADAFDALAKAAATLPADVGADATPKPVKKKAKPARKSAKRKPKKTAKRAKADD